jgi:hypothetical protein
MNQGVRELRASSAPVVLAAGAITIGLALLGVFAANRAGENIMGWYANYVLPAGALLVGLVAASGFGISSYLTGTKIGGGLLALVVALLAGSYALAHLVEFRLLFPDGAADDQGNPVGFATWFDLTTRSFRFERGSALGGWGYAFRGLEILGFVGGGALVPILLRMVPYCDSCGLYKRSRAIALIPAAVWGKLPNPKRDPAGAAAHASDTANARAAADAAVDALKAAARGADASALRTAIEASGPLSRKRQTGKLQARIAVTLVHCRRCHDGKLVTRLVTGQGNRIRQVALADPAPVDREVVRDFVRAP